MQWEDMSHTNQIQLGCFLALSLRSFAECQAIHTKLMQTEFESEGKWLLGFKRLVDVYTSVPSS